MYTQDLLKGLVHEYIERMHRYNPESPGPSTDYISLIKDTRGKDKGVRREGEEGSRGERRKG